MGNNRAIKVAHERTINVGLEAGNCLSPYKVVMGPRPERLYVTMMHSGNVAVLDRETLAPKKVIPLPGCGSSLWAEAALEPRSGRVYVSSYNMGGVWAVDTKSDAAVRVGGDWNAPGQVISDGEGGVLLAHGGGDEVVRLDGATGTITSRIPVDPWPTALALDEKRGRLHVTCQHANLSRAQMLVDPLPFPDGTLCTVDLKTKKVDRVALGRRPSGVAVDAVSGLAYVTEMADNYVAVVDSQAGGVVGRIGVKCSPFGVEYDPKSGLVFALCVYGEVYDTEGQPSPVAVIDVRKRELVRYLNPGKMAHQVTVDGERGVIYVGAEDTCDVRALDVKTGETVARSSMLGLTVDGMEPYLQANRLFIPSHFTESCLAVDTKTWKVVADLKCGGWVTGAAVNRNTGMVYVHNAEDGEVAVFDARSGARVAVVNLNVGVNLVHRMWNGIAADSQRNRAYVFLSRRNALAAIDGGRNRLAGRVYLGPPHLPEPDRYPGSYYFRIAVNEKSGRLYVIDPITLVLSVVNGETLDLEKRIDLSSLHLPVPRPGDNPRSRRYNHLYNLSVDTTRDRVYVWNAIIDEASMKVVGQLPPETCTGVTGIDEKTGRLYCHGLRGLTILDANDYRELGNIPINPNRTIDSELRTLWMVEPEHQRIYQVREVMNQGNQIDIHTLQ